MKNLFLFFSLMIFSVCSFASTFVGSSSKTGSYTVPKGKYARVLNATGDVTLNGVEIFLKSTVAGTLVSTAFSSMHDLSPGDCVHVTSSVATDILVLSFMSATPSPTGVKVGNSNNFKSCSLNGKFYTNAYGITALTINIGKSVKEFYAKSGDVINATKYFVELYER